MPKFARVLGFPVLVAGCAGAALALVALADARESSRILALLTRGSESPVAASDGLLHWRVASVAVLVVSVACVVAAVAMLLRRRWSLMLLGWVGVFLIVVQSLAHGAGYVRYAFEVPEVAELLLVAIAVACCAAGYWSWPITSERV